jgi:hypothetical protein
LPGSFSDGTVGFGFHFTGAPDFLGILPTSAAFTNQVAHAFTSNLRSPNQDQFFVSVRDTSTVFSASSANASNVRPVRVLGSNDLSPNPTTETASWRGGRRGLVQRNLRPLAVAPRFGALKPPPSSWAVRPFNTSTICATEEPPDLAKG